MKPPSSLTLAALLLGFGVLGVAESAIAQTPRLGPRSAREELRERYSPRSAPFNPPSIRGNQTNRIAPSNAVLTPRNGQISPWTNESVLMPKPQNQIMTPGPRMTPESSLIIPHSGLSLPANPTD
ncbi:hypothetical protein H6G20_02035 [Desertifilum sp. FACHB-1129]|uniref:Uncharacterized protein n=1 Tax=Desertifilum tharense IPPAS B-1220 TaxID=1781255 RepID=A0A1E5QEN0_9CYAN|nr:MULTISPECIES: hypothetical protein [Desertifilum]MCD8486066.1 hypothetical protein [Desertifilum sp.]MDA0208970.1 hypothetical protein [Cyanobacteria bacterium FC1]MBD2310453.1 hypothetical protein [Desertifilum sp. FACHB-1129]MBD2321905.1 hypothetical protein [Desertifilum sp. FACHB-866]MBD2332032.1 hypothetical protein [Desertifilum sp. FACHB-868]